jgi:DNA-binding NarL/FixJ family response regulator
MGNDIRVAIIHPSRLFREGLANLLSQHPDLSINTMVTKATELLTGRERWYPDVIVMALSQSEPDIPEVIRQLRDVFPKAKALILGLNNLESHILSCIEAGAAGYLPQEATLEDLLNHIRAVVAGEALCSPKVAGLLFSHLEKNAQRWERLYDTDLKRLTPREREVVALIETGLSNKEISVQLRIEVSTVKNHVHHILEKLQLSGRWEAARYARENSLVGRLGWVGR